MTKKILLLVIIDQITKLVFRSSDFFLGPIHIHTMKNIGLAFSVDFGIIVNIVFICLGLGYFIFYYWSRRRLLSFLGELIFILIFAGAISNILDRIVLSYVRDFIDMGLGFTFNLADVYVIAGLIMFLFLPDGDKYVN
jgi:signal peptidase II